MLRLVYVCSTRELQRRQTNYRVGGAGSACFKSSCAGVADRGVWLAVVGVLVPLGPNEATGAISFWSSPADTPLMYALALALSVIRPYVEVAVGPQK